MSARSVSRSVAFPRMGAHKLLRSLALVLLAAACAMGASAQQPVAKPRMKIGDHWSFRVSGGPEPSEQWREEVVDVMPDGRYRARIVYPTRPEQIVDIDGPGNVVQRPPHATLYAVQYPLTLGKRWKASVADTPAQTRTIDYRVAAAEKVSVAAGEFDCLRLEGRETTVVAGAAVPAQGTLWYCPAVRNFARRELNIPGVGVVRHELLSYRLMP
jgi:hypothetical protein